jgi:hypothetical protein
MPKQIVTTKMKGRRKRGRPRKRWKDEVQEDLKIMGMKNRACRCQRPSGMEKPCIASQGPLEEQ